MMQRDKSVMPQGAGRIVHRVIPTFCGQSVARVVVGTCRIAAPLGECRSAPALPVSLCGSAALHRAQARQLRAYARGHDRSLRRESLWLLMLFLTLGQPLYAKQEPHKFDWRCW